MRDLLSWNISLGRWFGVPVRLHVFFVLFALVAAHLATGDASQQWGALAAAGLGLLFVSVVWHEFAHCLAAWRLGARIQGVLLWPAGGLTPVHAPLEPEDELVVSASGPISNLLVCLLLLPALWLARSEFDGGLQFSRLIHPLAPPVGAGPLRAVDLLPLAFWINWLLLLVNLLPAQCLDGGRVLRAILWTQTDVRTAGIWVASAARVAAFLLLPVALYLHHDYPFSTLPISLLAVFLFFSGRQELERLRDAEDHAWEAGDEAALAAGERSGGSLWAVLKQWWRRRALEREQRAVERAAAEERLADELLARLYEHGPSALSPADRAVLDRVSARYRSRQQR